MTTYLFPNLTFGCNGTIVKLTVGMAKGPNAANNPQTVRLNIQIWRKNKSDLYYKAGPEVEVPISDSSCVSEFNAVEGRCVSSNKDASLRVSVQSGDILGLELPPTNNDGYEILFTRNDEHKSYIFQHQNLILNSTVTANLSEADNVTNHLPQIIPLVILGNY